MYTLFEQTPTTLPARFTYLGSTTLFGRWADNIRRLQGHWAASGYSVPTDHVLVSLLNGLPPVDDTDPVVYRDSIVDALPQLCMGAGIAHASNQRVVAGRSFYGVPQQEILLSVQGEWDPVSAVQQWETLEPLQVLRYPSTAISLGLPNGQGHDVGYGFAVIAIDIPLLVMMYRGWCGVERHIPERLGQFIGQYVLPSMLWSQLNVGWFNYLNGWVQDQPINGLSNPNSLALPMVDVNVERLGLRLLKDTATHRMGFVELMTTVPSLRGTKLIEHLQPPKTIATRQNEWALQLAYFDYVKFAWVHAQLFEGSHTLTVRNHLRRLMSRIRSDRLWDAAPMAIRQLVKADFDFTLGYSIT